MPADPTPGARRGRGAPRGKRTLYPEGTREEVLRRLSPGVHPATAAPSDAVFLTELAVVPLDGSFEELTSQPPTAASPIARQVRLPSAFP